MKKICLFGLFWLGTVSSLWAQDLRVVVKEEHEKTPLVGVAMLILENRQGAVSDENGLVTFSNPPIGKITLRFQLIGFESKQMTIKWPDVASNMPDVDFACNQFINFKRFRDIVERTNL